MFDAGFQIADRERKAIPLLRSLLADPDMFEARLNFSDFEDDLGDLDSFRDFHSKVSFASGGVRRPFRPLRDRTIVSVDLQ